MTYVDYRDVAETAAIAMTGSRLDNSTFELAAPGMVNTTTIAALFASELGRPVEAARSGFEAWASRAGIPEGPLRNGLARMSADYDAHGFHGGNSLVLETILGRSPRSLGAYIREMVGAGKLVVARVWMLISTRSRSRLPYHLRLRITLRISWLPRSSDAATSLQRSGNEHRQTILVGR